MPAAQVRKEGSRMISRAMWIGAALLGLAAGTGFAADGITPAPDIEILDLTDAPPTVNLSPTLTALGFTATISPETVSISGLLPVSAAGVIVAVGTRDVGLTEPAVDPFNQPVSDVVELTAGDVVINPTSNLAFQRILIQFKSDLFGPPTLPPNALTLPETGLSQDVSVGLHSFPLTISVASDLNTGEPTPLPASAWSGLALLGGLATWRIVRHRQARVATL